MTTLFDEGKAYATKHPKRSANPDGSGALTGWDSWCQSLAWRFSDAYGHGANPSFDSALKAAQASGELNKDWKSAKPGAYHYWGTGVGPDGHVGIDLKGGGSWIFMASNHITTVWGDAIGCASWTQYQAAIGDSSGAKYLGWSMKNGTGYINVPKTATVTPIKPSVAPSATVTPIPTPATAHPANPVSQPVKSPSTAPTKRKPAVNKIASSEASKVLADAAGIDDEKSKVSNMTLFSRAFWTYAGERIIKSFAYSLNGLLVTNGVGLINIDWAGALSVAGLAALSSLLVALSSFKDI